MDGPFFEGFGGASDAVERSILASPLLGGGLPAEARAHLDKAAERYAMADVAETHLFQAEAIAPDHAAVLIALTGVLSGGVFAWLQMQTTIYVGDGTQFLFKLLTWAAAIALAPGWLAAKL